MVVRSKTQIRFRDYRFNLSASKLPQVTLAQREFFDFARGMVNYRGMVAFQEALDKVGLSKSDWPRRYTLKGPIMVDVLMKERLDRIDFSSFKGETTRELEMFINDELEIPFEVVILNLGGRLGGFIFVAEDNNMLEVKKFFLESFTRHDGVKRPI